MRKVLADSVQLSYCDWGESQWLAERGLGNGQCHRHDTARASTPHTAILQPRKSRRPLGHISFMAIAGCYSFYYTFAVILVVGA